MSHLARWTLTARAHDPGLYQHSVLVGELTAIFAAYLGFTTGDQHRLADAALLHDIGKTRIAAELLRKPGPLTAPEMLEMRLHPELGHQLLFEEGGYSTETLSVVRDHHERLDGTGYPNGLHGSEILEPVRIVMLCDIYAAMTEERSYATPFQPHEALLLMAAKRTRLDQRLMKHFSAMVVGIALNRAEWSWRRHIREHFR